MNIRGFLVVLCSAALCLHGQSDTITVKTKFKNNSKYRGKVKEVYSITLPDSLRNGSYVEYSERFTIRRKGQYKEGVKEGIWSTYSDYDKLLMEGEYKDGKKVGIWSQYSNDAKGVLLEQLDWDNRKMVFRDTARYPIGYPYYFGGGAGVGRYIIDEMDKVVGEEEKAALKGKHVQIIHEIDATGKPINVQVVKGTNTLQNPAVESKIIEIIKNMPNWDWGEKTPEDFMLKLRFSIPITFS